MIEFQSTNVESNVGVREFVDNQHFLLFPQSLVFFFFVLFFFFSQNSFQYNKCMDCFVNIELDLCLSLLNIFKGMDGDTARGLCEASD